MLIFHSAQSQSDNCISFCSWPPRDKRITWLKPTHLTLKGFNCICVNRGKSCHQQPATQNGTSNGRVSGRLVDGNHTPYFGNDAFPETEAGSLLWEVDIGAKFYVTLVTITTLADNCWEELNKFSILCFGCVWAYWRNDYIHLQKSGKKNACTNYIQYDSRCEVDIHGYSFNIYENKGKDGIFIHSTSVIVGLLGVHCFKNYMQIQILVISSAILDRIWRHFSIDCAKLPYWASYKVYSAKLLYWASCKFYGLPIRFIFSGSKVERYV